MTASRATPTVADVRCCRITDPGMGAEEAAAVAARFKAVADVTRVRIVNLLAAHGTLCVCELQDHFDLSQPTVSHHLSVLRRAGIVETEAHGGRWAFYRVRPEAIEELQAILGGHRPANGSQTTSREG